MPETTLSGRRIVWREAGNGPPVILLHCSSSHSGQWKPLIEQLSGAFRCLAPDLHGYGQSEIIPDDGQPYGPHDAAIVKHLLDVVDEPAHVVGHSLGGTIALRAALDNPGRLRSLTLIEPVLFGFLEAARDPDRLEYLQVAHDALIMMHFENAKGAAKLFTDFWMGDGAFEAMDAATQSYVVSVMPRVAEDWLGISHVAPGALSLGDLAKLTMPCHLVRSEDTQVSVQKIMSLLKTALPDARWSEVPKAGHMAPVTHASTVNPLIADFLSDLA